MTMPLLNRAEKINYSLGSTAEAIALTATSSFLLIYSTRTFFARIDQALGTALAGWVLAMIAFPAKAVPGQVDPGVLSNLVLATILSTIPGLLAAASYVFLKVTRATHDATRAALDEKQRVSDAAVA